MSFLQSLLLGAIQGLTEFFPISSSGHLFLLEKFLDVNHNSLSFALILHGATLLSIITVFFKDFIQSMKQKKSQQIDLVLKVVVSSLPLAFVGLFLKDLVLLGFQELVVALGFLLTGLLLLSLKFRKQSSETSLEDLSLIKFFVIGLFQAIAVLPGFSRSGWAVSACLFLGLSKKDSVYYSFLIAIPAVGGSLLIELIQNFQAIEFSAELFVAFFVSYLIGVGALLLILRLVEKQQFSIFAFYLLPLSFYLLLF